MKTQTDTQLIDWLDEHGFVVIQANERPKIKIREQIKNIMFYGYFGKKKYFLSLKEE